MLVSTECPRLVGKDNTYVAVEYRNGFALMYADSWLIGTCPGVWWLGIYGVRDDEE